MGSLASDGVEPGAVFWRALGGTESEAKERAAASDPSYPRGGTRRALKYTPSPERMASSASTPLTYWNPFAKHFIDGGPTRFWVVNHGSYCGTSTREEANQHMAALEAGQSWSREFEILCKKREYLPAVITLSPVPHEEGVSIGTFGISREIALFRIIPEAPWKFLNYDPGRGLPVVDDRQTNHGVGIQDYARTVAALRWPSGDRINEHRHDR